MLSEAPLLTCSQCRRPAGHSRDVGGDRPRTFLDYRSSPPIPGPPLLVAKESLARSRRSRPDRTPTSRTLTRRWSVAVAVVCSAWLRVIALRGKGVTPICDGFVYRCARAVQWTAGSLCAQDKRPRARCVVTRWRLASGAAPSRLRPAVWPHVARDPEYYLVVIVGLVVAEAARLGEPLVSPFVRRVPGTLVWVAT